MQVFLMALLRNKYVAGSLLVAVLTAAGWGYVKYQNSKIENLERDNAMLEKLNESWSEAVDARDDVINNLQEQREQQVVVERKLRQEFRAADQYTRDLMDKLSKHDLTYLALRKPGLIENRINDGSNELWDDFEEISARPDSE